MSTFPYNENGLNAQSGDCHPLFSLYFEDHVLTGDEAIGKALLGTSVSGDVYKDFYNRCISEKEAPETVVQEITLGNGAITGFVHPNGHIFYDITDKGVVDEFFNTFGVAWFYGIDVQNKRIYLPRNDWFFQAACDPSKVNQFNEAGLPNVTANIHLFSASGDAISKTERVGSYQGGSSAGATMAYFDASVANPVYGNSNTVQPPSSSKLVYMKVGNTIVKESQIDVSQVLSDLQMKADKDFSNVTRPYVTETYTNGTSGYRVWSDGYKEQWGCQNAGQVSFILEFKNTDYSITVATTQDVNVEFSNLTTAGFTLGANGCWRAEGY